MENAKNQSREIFVFVGQNAPHHVTGIMRIKGEVYRFDGTLKQANKLVKEIRVKYPQMIFQTGGYKKINTFASENKVVIFNTDFDYAKLVLPDDENKRIDNWVKKNEWRIDRDRG